MLGEVNRSRDSCSDSFFRRRSMTFEPLLALWNHSWIHYTLYLIKTDHYVWWTTTTLEPFSYITTWFWRNDTSLRRVWILLPGHLASCAVYLLLLNLTAEVGDLDLDGVQLFIWDLGDRKWLRLLGALEGQLSQGDIPLAVILLVFAAKEFVVMDGERDENQINTTWTQKLNDIWLVKTKSWNHQKQGKK